MTDTPTPIEPSAVVAFTNADEYLSALDTDSMAPQGLGHYDAADLELASAVIERFAPEGSLESVVVLTLAQLAADYAMRGRVAPSRATSLVQRAWKDLAVDADTSIARVTISLDEPEVLDPQVCFVSLRPGMRLFKQGVSEALAIAYYPSTVREVVDRITGEITELASWFDQDRYSHVMAVYADCDDAEAAARELRQAVQTFQKARVIDQYADDPVRGAIQLASVTASRRPRESVL